MQSKEEHKSNRIKALHAKDYLRQWKGEAGNTSGRKIMVARKIVNSLDVAHSGWVACPRPTHSMLHSISTARWQQQPAQQLNLIHIQMPNGMTMLFAADGLGGGIAS